MAEERMKVQLATKERLYVRVYKDFLATEHLTTEEKMVYIVLKSFVDFRYDEGQAYPSMETICLQTSMSRPRATRAINSLIEKGIVKKKRQGLTKPNLYTLYDNPSMWAAGSAEELREMAESEIPFTTQTLIDELKRRGVITKIEKEPVSGTGQSSDASTSHEKLNIVLTTNNSIIEKQDCQEKYKLSDIQEFFDYTVLVHDKRAAVKDIDAVMDILYDTLNSTKKTIRVMGEDKPAAVVIGKLMKLTYEEIQYAIEKFNSTTDRVRDPKAYMLTILYAAREQMRLDINNQVQHDLHGETGGIS